MCVDLDSTFIFYLELAIMSLSGGWIFVVVFVLFYFRCYWGLNQTHLLEHWRNLSQPDMEMLSFVSEEYGNLEKPRKPPLL